MRFDLRLRGKTGGGRACVMDVTVYAGSGDELQEEARRRSEEGPWYFDGGSEPVPEGEHITVERVEQIGGAKHTGRAK